MMKIETTQLNNGTVVLAKKDRYGYFGAVTYTNDTQAQRMLDKLTQAGTRARIYVGPWSRVRYIAIP